MNLHAVPGKTELGKQLLRQRASSINRSQRAALIMIDGSKTLLQLTSILQALGLDERDLHQLTDAGLIEWKGRDGASGRISLGASSRAVAQASQAPSVSVSVSVSGNKSVAAAKLFALDLAERMLVQRDHGLREAARQVMHEQQFLPWLDRCAAAIGHAAGPERAAMFIEKVMALVPDALIASHRSASIDLEL